MSLSETCRHGQKQEQDDETFLMERVGCDAAQHWSSLPMEFRCNKAYILHALRNSPTLPPKSDLEEVLPEELSEDRDIVLAFCQRADFATRWRGDGEPFKIPERLRSDKQIMTIYCRKIPGGLACCSLELRSDPVIVRTAVLRDGMNLRHAALDLLLDDEELIRIACRQSKGRAFAFCLPGLALQKFCSDRSFMLDIITSSSSDNVAEVWKYVPNHLKMDHRFVERTLMAGLPIKEIPEEFSNSDEGKEIIERWRWKQNIFHENDTWQLQDPHPIQQKRSRSSNWHHAWWLEKNHLVTDPEIFIATLTSGGPFNSPTPFHQWLMEDVQILVAVLQTFNLAWTDNQDVMKRMVHLNGLAITLASPRLRQSSSFLKEIITSQSLVGIMHAAKTDSFIQQFFHQNANMIGSSMTTHNMRAVFQEMESDLLVQHPEILLDALCDGRFKDISSIASSVPLQLWRNKRFVLDWLAKGGWAFKILEPRFGWRKDRDVAMAIAKYQWQSFAMISETLLHDADFVLQAFQESGKLSPGALEDPNIFIEDLASGRLLDSTTSTSQRQMGDVQLLVTILQSTIQTWTDDEDVMTRIIRLDGRTIIMASPRLRQSSRFLKEVTTSQSIVGIMHATRTDSFIQRFFNQNPNIVGSSLTTRNFRTVFQEMESDLLVQHPEILLHALCDGRIKDTTIVPSVPHQLWSNKRFILGWLAKGGTTRIILQRRFRWREDRDVAMAIAKYQWQSFTMISETLLHDADFILQAFQESGKLSPGALEDPNIFIEDLASGRLLDSTTSTSQRQMGDVQLLAMLLQSSIQTWTDDEGVMTRIVHLDGRAIALASARLRQSTAFLKHAITSNSLGGVLWAANSDSLVKQQLKQIPNLIWDSITAQNVQTVFQTGDVQMLVTILQSTSQIWKDDEEIMTRIVHLDGRAIILASPRLRQSAAFFKDAITSSSLAGILRAAKAESFLQQQLMEHPNLIKAAITVDNADAVLQETNPAIVGRHPDIIRQVLEVSGSLPMVKTDELPSQQATSKKDNHQSQAALGESMLSSETRLCVEEEELLETPISTMTEHIKGDAAYHCSTSPMECQCSKEYVLHVLRNSPTLSSVNADFGNVFMQALSEDRDIVLAFCQREDFVTLKKERNFEIPESLRSDKQVMMTYCQKIPGALQFCSVDLQNDPAVVKAAVTLDGMNLRYAGATLIENDEALVRTACQSNGRALEFCPPGPILNSILNDRAFVMEMLTHTPQAVGIIWDSAPESLQVDADFVKLAMKSEEQNLKQDVHDDPDSYLDMDTTLQQNIHIAYEALVSPNSNSVVQARALEHFPDLAKTNREVAVSISKTGDLQMMEGMLSSNPRWLDDGKVMKEAVRRKGQFFWQCSPRLRQCPDFVRESITQVSAASVIEAVSTTFLVKHPEIIREAVSHDGQHFDLGSLIRSRIAREFGALTIVSQDRSSELQYVNSPVPNVRIKNHEVKKKRGLRGKIASDLSKLSPSFHVRKASSQQRRSRTFQKQFLPLASQQQTKHNSDETGEGTPLDNRKCEFVFDDASMVDIPAPNATEEVTSLMQDFDIVSYASSTPVVVDYPFEEDTQQ